MLSRKIAVYIEINDLHSTFLSKTLPLEIFSQHLLPSRKPDNEQCNTIRRISNFLFRTLFVRHSKRSTNDKTKEEAKNQPGTYKTKEEIEKPPKMDHPCNLTRTTVRISFPELKGEVFVNLLGYKEPNLIPLWRCKGIFHYLESRKSHHP